MFQDMPKPINGEGSVGTQKVYTSSSFTIATGSSQTITISDMKTYCASYGKVTWQNTFPFFNSVASGDMVYRNNAWETAPSTYLSVTVSGNQVTITNPTGVGTATIGQFEVIYY